MGKNTSKIALFLSCFLIVLSFSFCYADEGSIEGEIEAIADVLTTIGIALAVFKLMQIGIKFMFSASGGKKSDAKASLIPWIVGLAVCVLWKTLGSWFIDDVLGGAGRQRTF